MPGNAFWLLYGSSNGALKSLSRYDVFNCWVQNNGIVCHSNITRF